MAVEAEKEDIVPGPSTERRRQIDAAYARLHTEKAQSIRRSPFGTQFPEEETEEVPGTAKDRLAQRRETTRKAYDKISEDPFSREARDRRRQEIDGIKLPAPRAYPISSEAKNLAAPGENRLDVNVVDFLFGGEMSVAGMKYDNSGLHWNMDIAKQQWSEQPLWINLLNTTSLMGTMAFPALRAVTASAKFGKLATGLKRVGGVSKADEIAYYQKLGILESGEIAGKTLELARRQEIYRSRYQDLSKKLELAGRGEGNFTLTEKLRLQFDKQFANRFFDIAGSHIDGNEHVKDLFYKNLDELFKSEDIGRFFLNMPDEEAGPRIYQYLLNKTKPGLLTASKLAPNEKQWADMLDSASRSHQMEALEHSLITPETVKKVGEIHLPALFKGTPKPDLATSRKYYLPSSRKPTRRELAEGLSKEDRIEILRPFDMPRLDSPTLKARAADLPEVARRLLDGELITDPMELTVRGYMMDRMLLNNYRVVTDIATNSKYASSHFDIMAKYGGQKAAEKAGFVSLDQLQGNIPSTLRRMIGKKDASFIGTADELPWVRRSVYEDMFGDSGIFAQTQMAANVLQVGTAIHKTAKTALSVPTHFQNLISNMVMLSQAGFNILSPENLKITQKMASSFNDLAKAHRKAADIAKATGAKAPSRIDELGVNLGTIKIGKKTFDLNDEILDPRVRELIEDSAFESVEGFQSLVRMSEQMEEGLGKGLAKTMIGAKKILQMGDREGFRWFDQMTKWYLGEDMVPKMTYYMGLRAKGLTKEAAILEVGRRLPMYGTVGPAIKGGRRWLFPWATFPTEALRITKNNMMDHPLRLLPWLHMPGIMQSFASAFGAAPETKAEVDAAKRQLPMWAQTSQTVAMNEQSGNRLGAGLTGAVAGGVAGTLKGGAVGGLLGAAAGVAGSELINSSVTDPEGADSLRGAVIDWLPHASFYLTTTSPEFGGEVYPFKDIMGLWEQLPAEPLAILKPFVDVLYGKTSWGEEIGGYDVGDKIGKAISGMIGTMSPPFIQKYGLKTTTPDVSLSEYVTGDHVPGDFTNVSRLLMDSSVQIDPLTGKPGNFTNEIFLKNFGIWKSWATDPAHQLSNEQTTDLNFQSVRSDASKNLAYYLENGQDDKATELLSFVMATFSNQYADNPRLAQDKYGDWLKARVKAIGRHPRLRTWSEEEIKNRLISVTRFAGEERGKARDDMMTFLSNQLSTRRHQRMQKKKETGLDEKRKKMQERRTRGRSLGGPANTGRGKGILGIE